MARYRIGEAAELLGVSVDTMRRWADAKRVKSVRTDNGQRLIDGADLARFASARAEGADGSTSGSQSARNRFAGIVTRVVKDEVVAKVELQAGRNRIVSLMTREACDDLHLAPGVLATAVVKATNVVVEVTRTPDRA